MSIFANTIVAVQLTVPVNAKGCREDLPFLPAVLIWKAELLSGGYLRRGI